MKPRAIIVDLDMTLADSSARSHLISESKKDWTAWHSQTHTDTVIKPIKRLCFGMHETGYKLIFLTARSEVCKLDTEAWLYENIPWLTNFELIMRAEGDHRPSPITKKDLYLQHVEPRYTVMFAIDDLLENIEMFESLGVYTLQVRVK